MTDTLRIACIKEAIADCRAAGDPPTVMSVAPHLPPGFALTSDELTEALKATVAMTAGLKQASAPVIDLTKKRNAVRPEQYRQALSEQHLAYVELKTAGYVKARTSRELQIARDNLASGHSVKGMSAEECRRAVVAQSIANRAAIKERVTAMSIARGYTPEQAAKIPLPRDVTKMRREPVKGPDGNWYRPSPKPLARGADGKPTYVGDIPGGRVNPETGKQQYADWTPPANAGKNPDAPTGVL